VKSIFWPTDVSRILQISLTSGRDDCVAWHYNRNGLFSVRPAYHCQWERKFGSRTRSVQASGANICSAWKRLWKLKIPSKMKIFGWPALKGFIPCKAILANRHIGSTGGCPVCQNGAEDKKHIIFTCDRAKEVWKSIGLWETIIQLFGTNRSGSIVPEEVLRRNDRVRHLELGLMELVFTGGWYLWLERRKSFMEKGPSAHQGRVYPLPLLQRIIH